MERLWTMSYAFMVKATLFQFTAFYMLYPTLPLFIRQVGGNETHIGLAMGAFMLSSVFVRPLIGGLLDVWGRRPFIVGGLLLFAIVLSMYNWIGGVVALMVLRVLHGMSWGVSSTAVQTATTDMIPPARRGEGMGWMGMAMTLAMAFGPMFGIWVTQTSSYRTLFLFAVGFTLGALLLTAGATMPFRPQPGARRIDILEKSVLPVATSAFFMFFAYASITTFVPVFADSIDVNSGTFFLVYAIMLALSRPIAGKLSDRRGETVVIVPALVAMVLALFVLSCSTTLLGVLVAAVLYGIGFGSAHPVFYAAIIRLANPERKGVANAAFTTAIDLGIGVGAIVLGWIAQQTSYQVLFAVSALSVVCSLLLFLLLVKRLLVRKATPQANTRVDFSQAK